MTALPEAKNVTIEMDDRFFTMTMPVREVKLIETVLRALGQYVDSGPAILLRHAYKNLPSDSQHMMSKVIRKASQIDEFMAELKQLISVISKLED